MLRYYYINKEWILSATARRVYRVAATLSMLLFFILWAKRFLLALPPGAISIVRLLVFAGVVGAATTIVAMEYFLFGFDKSPAWKRLIWFCVMLLPPLGPPLYCFIVYLRSDALKSSEPRHVQNVA